ncbi:MAG: GNAT family N-acetyltransferase [Bacteroidia bacterium]|nr:GNAT family N-acetyltransferase [Bacteroidia bacterium]
MVVGFISLHNYIAPHLPGMIGRITAFCVDEKFQGKGIGTDLSEAAEQYFKILIALKLK